MKKIRHLLVCASLALVSTIALHGQGALTPPGAPAPTMKTLAQIEPRRPVDAVNTPGDGANVFIITAPGSYYLTADVVATSGRSGIRINVGDARGVTIDLNGFAVIGAGQDAGDGGRGIVSNSEITPVNLSGGRVVGWAAQGVFIGGAAHVRDLFVADCGDSGIQVNGGPFVEGDDSRIGVIERCEVRNTRIYGINAFTSRVRDCSVSRVRNAGTREAIGIAAIQVIDSRVRNVVDTGTAVTNGILAETVTDCVVEDVVGGGFTTHITARIVTGCKVGRTVAPISAISVDRGIDGQLVERCHVFRLQSNTSDTVHGIYATQVSNNVVERVANAGAGGVFGIGPSRVALSGTSESSTTAIHAEGNTVSGIAGIGIAGGSAPARVIGNLVRGCTGDAIASVSGGSVTDNTINLPSGGTGDGIDVADSQVQGNYVRNFGTGVGVRISFSGVAVRNTVQGGTAFSFASGVRAGPTVTGGGTTAFDANANLDL